MNSIKKLLQTGPALRFFEVYAHSAGPATELGVRRSGSPLRKALRCGGKVGRVSVPTIRLLAAVPGGLKSEKEVFGPNTSL
jgi:hypothetical protein